MSYQDRDPLRRDPELDRDLNMRTDPYTERRSNAMWGWIAGAVVLVLLLVFLFGGTQNTTTADINNSPAAPSITAPSGNNTAPPPNRSPTETTGQSQTPSQSQQ